MSDNVSSTSIPAKFYAVSEIPGKRGQRVQIPVKLVLVHSDAAVSRAVPTLKSAQEQRIQSLLEAFDASLPKLDLLSAIDEIS